MSSSSVTQPRVVSVVGATAAGKSDLAVALARTLGGEVINTDSMQLYRGMDIGTAKLTPAERGGIPHHLMDIWDVTEAASVAEYQRLARAEMDRLLAEGRTPVLVGGSGLYVRAAIDEMEFPGTDPAVRARLEAECEQLGSGALHRRLAELDPAAAAAILPSNGRRVVRALEVIEITGRPFTASLPTNTAVYDTVQIGVQVERPELDRRIELRVDRMWRGRSARRGPRAGGTGAAGRADRLPGARLPAGAGPLRGRLHRAGGEGRNRTGDQAVRPPPGVLVPPGRPDPLAGPPGRCGPDGAAGTGPGADRPSDLSGFRPSGRCSCRCTTN